jgi:Polyketide cyclase / dehydrase and lipid transport
MTDTNRRTVQRHASSVAPLRQVDGVQPHLSQTVGVHRVISAETAVPAARLFAAMNDLGTYGEWMSLIDHCDPVDPVDPVDTASGDLGPAWIVTLKAKVGPFARSKRLRMVRVESTPNSSVRYERNEVDGKQHSAWVMEATISETGTSESSVTVELTYSGGLWSGPLDVVLGSQVDEARERLRAYLEK